MIKNIFYRGIVIFLLIYIVGCKNKHTMCASTDQTTSYQDVFNTVHAISSKYNDGPIEFPINLIEDSRFENFSTSPCKFKTHLLSIIADDRASSNEKFIALFALQHLCIEDYIKVIEVVFSEYQDKKLDDYFLHVAIFQGQFSLEVIKKYDHKTLIQKLEIIKAEQQRMGKDISNLNELLSGHIWRGLDDFYIDSGEQRPFSCN